MLFLNFFRSRYGNAVGFVNDLMALLVLVAFTFVFSGTTMAVGTIRILALGDSLSSGYGLLRADSFPSQLERALLKRGFIAKVTNAGVSGDTSAGGLSRLEWTLSEGFDAVIIELGANDGLRGLEPQETLKNLDSILDKLKQKNIAALLTGMQAPPNLGAEYGKEFAAIFPYLATKYDILFYPFFLEGVAAVDDLNQKDNIHPNSEGVGVIVKKILPYVIELSKAVKLR
jgi:acyl-CoA thioesterase-1